MSKIRLKNFLFDEDGVSKFENISEGAGEKTGKFLSTIGKGMIILILSFVFGFIAGMGRFGKGFRKGMK